MGVSSSNSLSQVRCAIILNNFKMNKFCLYASALIALAYTGSCLKCYDGIGDAAKKDKECTAGLDRCSTTGTGAATVKKCMLEAACIDPIKCCKEDNCNGVSR